MSSPNPTDGSRLPLATVVVPAPLAYAPKAIAQPLYVGQPSPRPYVGVPAHNVPSNEGMWTTGLCDCFDDMTNCVITYFCPCVTFGQIAKIIDRGNTSCACTGAMCCMICHFFYCSFWYTCTYRTKLRGLYLIPGNQ
ncbi:hypothetical protein NL676_003647 [Syzygium grande]|nr:hypothetical protein NL676_003647 [Syzygium grande]